MSVAEILKRKVLVAVAGADGDPRGALRSALVQRFIQPKRREPSRREAEAAIEALLEEGALEEVERTRGAKGLRLGEAGRAAYLGLRFDAAGIVRCRFTGKQVEEALTPLRLAVARMRDRDAGAPFDERQQAEGGAPADGARGAPGSVEGGTLAASVPELDGAAPERSALADPGLAGPPLEGPPLEGPALEAAIVDAAVRIERDEALPGRLIPVHRVRARVPAERRAFDTALWALARQKRGTLLKLNDEARMGEAERAASFRHPFTGSLYYYFRPAETA